MFNYHLEISSNKYRTKGIPAHLMNENMELVNLSTSRRVYPSSLLTSSINASNFNWKFDIQPPHQVFFTSYACPSKIRQKNLIKFSLYDFSFPK